MRLYRLTRRPYADLAGAGGLYATGRWHHHRAPIIYTSESRALAMLEVLAHLDVPFELLPDDYVFQVIEAPTDSIERIDTVDCKPGGRAEDTGAFGPAWLKARRSALLCAPSIVLPQECNVLINPAHPDVSAFEFEIENGVTWDRRLFS